MDLAINVLLLVSALIGSGTAFLGETLKKGPTTSPWKRIAPVGYAAIACLLFSFALGVWKEVRERAANTAQEEKTSHADIERRKAEEHVIQLQEQVADSQEKINESITSMRGELRRLSTNKELDRLLTPQEKAELEQALRTGDRILGIIELGRRRKKEQLLKNFNEGGNERPAWLQLALKEKGQKETENENPRILEYLKVTQELAEHKVSATQQTPWSSAFASWVMEQAGHAGPRTTNPSNWLQWAKRLDEPRLGCIVIRRLPSTGICRARFPFSVARMMKTYLFSAAISVMPWTSWH